MRKAILFKSLIFLTLQPSLLAAENKSEFQKPTHIPFPEDAPYSPQVATLGKMMFFDPRLSGAQNMNCASCHNPSFGFEVPVATAVGAANTPLGRQAPTIINAAWVQPLFWDGRAKTLEEQAEGPITNPAEMNAHFDAILARLSKVPDYVKWFDEAFPGTGMSKQTILSAIATYERTIVSGDSPFDLWVQGDEAAISAEAKRGFGIFTGKAGCSACHTGWNFTDNKFHDIGLPSDDVGRGALEPDNLSAQHAFKTPGLRNIVYRGPYMHDGSVPDLETVVRHYSSGGVGRSSQSSLVHPLSLGEDEIGELVEFMKSLTAAKQDTPLPVLPN